MSTPAVNRGAAHDVPGVKCRRDDAGRLHMTAGEWPEHIVVTLDGLAGIANNPPTADVYLTDDGVLMIRTAQGTAGYRQAGSTSGGQTAMARII